MAAGPPPTPDPGGLPGPDPSADSNPSADPDPPVGTGVRPAAIVLAGGAARRWGGVDKTAADLGGCPVLAHVLDGLPPGTPAVVVGPPGHPWAAHTDPVRVCWTREDPPGGGPSAGLAAGLAALAPDLGPVWLLAGDLPFAGTALPRLSAALTRSGADVALGIGPDGRRQPLLAACRLHPLRRALADAGPVAGLPLHAVLAGLRVVEVPVTAGEAFDLDTPADLVTARQRLAGPGLAGPGLAGPGPR